MKSWQLLSLTFVLALAGSLPTDAQNQRRTTTAAAATIVSVTPQNLSNTVNQVRATFSEKMVNLSTPSQKADIFTLSCTPQVEGKARWNDDKTWVFDFRSRLSGNFLPGGTSCRMELNKEVKTLAGAAITGKRTFAFQIDGPNILHLDPSSWDGQEVSINEDQVFIAELDTNVNLDSVLKNVYFSVDGKASAVPVRIIEGLQRQEILKAKLGVKDPTTPVVLLQAREVFAAKTKVTLVWGPGVVSNAGGSPRQLKATYNFVVREELRAQFTCVRENANAQCSPLMPLEIQFSAAIPTEKAKQIRLVAADGKVRTPDLRTEKATVVERVSFPGPFPENTQFKLEMPQGIKDEAGRELANAPLFPLVVRTAELPPLAKFPAEFGVVEAAEKPILLPATLRNLEAQVLGAYTGVNLGGATVRVTAANFPEVVKWMQRLNERNAYEDRDKSILGVRKDKVKFNLPLQKGGKSFEVVGIPLPGPGFYVVELESRILGKSLLGKDRTMFVPTGALVTNLAVHLKWGEESSLFWVTALDSGSPVAGANVKVHDCAGKILWQGTSDKDGLLSYSGRIKSLVNDSACKSEGVYGAYRGGFFVSAQQGGDFTFTHTSWSQGLDGYRFGINNFTNPAWSEARDQAHTVFARTLLRAGETVHMKHILRRPNAKGFATIPTKELPTEVWIEHAGSQTKYTLPLKWDAQVLVAETILPLPKEAKLGVYSVSLVKNGGKEYSDIQGAGSFRVEEFKIPLLKGSISLPKTPLVQPGVVEPQLTLAYQNGGPVTGDVTFRHSLNDAPFASTREYEDFRFVAGKVEEGIVRSGDQPDEPDKVVTQKVKLSAAGAGTAKISGLSGLTVPKSIRMEMEFKDANGEIQSIGRTATVWPAERLIGIRAQRWVAEDQDLDFQVVVLDLNQKPVKGATAQISAFKVESYSHRKRLVGGYYAYENVRETTRLPAAAKCSGTSDARGLIFCSMRVPQSGEVQLMAELSDEKGHRAFTNSSLWVRGQDDWWFGGDDNDRIDLVPERRRYEPNETARLQVRMPFRMATALVTFEREGVMEAKVMAISGQNPVIELPLKDVYAPNVFVSTFLVRGRVKTGDLEKPRPGQEFLVDLNKPAFKMGVTQLYVNWKTHELKVAVRPNKEIYQPREEVSLNVAVKDSAGKPAQGEFALAVVDEGLLQLQANSSWDLLKAMMGQRSWSVQTSTAQMQVVGKRHFGQKAVPTGGDGGSQMVRELFDTLVSWQARVKLNERGEATVKFKLNDSLTKFRVAVVAQSGLSQFGYGESSVSATQDLIAIPAQAPLARVGDKFDADLTLRNTTKKTIKARVGGQVTFTTADGQRQTKGFPEREISLSPDQGEVVNLGQVEVPVGAVRAEYEYKVAGDGGQRDSLKISQEIKPLLTARTQMSQLEQLGTSPVMVGVERPKDADPSQGLVRVKLMDSLARGLESVKEYFSFYFFPSFETQVSEAVALNDPKLWQAVMKRLPEHLDARGLIKYYPQAQTGSYELTTYVVAIAKDAGFALPSREFTSMQSALTALIEGRVRREQLRMSERELLLRRVAAMAALARYGSAKGEWLTSLTLPETSQLTAGTLIDLLRIDASLGGSSRPAATQWMNALKSRLTLVGTRMELAVDRENFWWMLSTRAGTQARLISLLVSSPQWLNSWRSELPKIQSGLMHYLRGGTWDLPITNAWAAVALRQFAKVVEAGKVSGQTQVDLSGVHRSFEWSKSPQGGVEEFSWPTGGMGKVTLSHRGDGKPWAMISTVAAVPVKGETSVGISIQKTITPVQQASAGQWRRGDVALVTLKIKAAAPVSKVALYDPIPAGAKILSSGLVGGGPDASNWMWPEYDEKSYDGYRAVFGYLPAEEFSITYRIQLNVSGKLNLPATRMEALYTPETFAELANPEWTVKP